MIALHFVTTTKYIHLYSHKLQLQKQETKNGVGFLEDKKAHERGLAQSPSRDCGQLQTMNHTVDTCPLTTFDGGLNLLHKVDDDAVIWLESAATAALSYPFNGPFPGLPG